jgi:hypothetical protein
MTIFNKMKVRAFINFMFITVFLCTCRKETDYRTLYIGSYHFSNSYYEGNIGSDTTIYEIYDGYVSFGGDGNLLIRFGSGSSDLRAYRVDKEGYLLMSCGETMGRIVGKELHFVENSSDCVEYPAHGSWYTLTINGVRF